MTTVKTKQLRLGEVLIEEGYLTEDMLKQALSTQKASSQKKRIGELLIETNMITEDLMLAALAKHLKIKFAKISDAPVSLEAVAKIPKSVAVKHCLIAYKIDRNTLSVHINDPLNYYAIEDIKLITHMNIEISVCKKHEIEMAINEYYSEIETQKAASNANQSASDSHTLSFVDISEAADDTPVVMLVNSTIYKAHSAGASDIHIEPFEKETSFRIRIDGQIVDYLTLSASLHNAIVARIKVLAGLDIAEKRAPQDGHFRAKLQDLEINARVSSLPTIYGEKIVMRFLDRNTKLDHAETFGMEQDDYEKTMRMLQVPHGLIYVTGPTGSGKTTTLYLAMELLAKQRANITTIEDPVEKALPRINQTQINPLAGLTFETGLRSILRQDPDIIMIGETRDAETANISVRAALTGHLVLSSLHTNDSISAIVRLLDMGIEDYLLANSLVGVVAQRLVKKLCPFCREEYAPNESELRVLDTRVDRLARGRGCHNCNDTGYKGRIAAHEVLLVDNTIRDMITRKVPTSDIYKYVSENGKIKTLRDRLSKLVIERVTSIDELLRLTYFVE